MGKIVRNLQTSWSYGLLKAIKQSNPGLYYVITENAKCKLTMAKIRTHHLPYNEDYVKYKNERILKRQK